MAQFSSVRYGARFPTFQSDRLNSSRAHTARLGYVNSPGAGQYSLASLVGNQNPRPAAAPAPPTAVTPATTGAPSEQARTTVQQGTKFTPPDAGSLSTDPILMQIRDLGQRQVGDARTGALGAAENALIGYGGVDMPQSLRDLYAGDPSNPIYAAFGDANTAAAAGANPDSTLALLANEHLRNQAGIDQSTNAQNLYYSSTHANQLGDEQTGYRQRQGQAQQSLAQLLGAANQGVLDASQHSADQYLAEIPNAYQRALDLASLLGGDPTAGSPVSGAAGGNDPLALPGGGDLYFDPRTGKLTPQRPGRGVYAA